MKKLALTAAALVVTAGTALAVPNTTTTPGKIQGSVHDLSGKAQDTARGEICIYCHTPHNAVVAVPLWNRHNPSQTTFQLYNSPTLTNAARTQSTINTTTSISLFCMSCHDGATGLGDVANRNLVSSTTGGLVGSTGADNTLSALASRTNENAALGSDLRTTHPIGFPFASVPGEDSGIRTEADIKTKFEEGRTNDGFTKTSVQEFLYGADKRFECASCHRVHDPGTSGNFLRIENYGSKLCLACHNK